jgi:hypothetical protein
LRPAVTRAGTSRLDINILASGIGRQRWLHFQFLKTRERKCFAIRIESIRAIRSFSIRAFRLAIRTRGRKKTNLFPGTTTRVTSSQLEGLSMRADDRIAVTALMEAKTFELRDAAAKAQAEALASGRRGEAISWAARLRRMDRRIEKFGLRRREVPKEIIDRARDVMYRAVSENA